MPGSLAGKRPRPRKTKPSASAGSASRSITPEPPWLSELEALLRDLIAWLDDRRVEAVVVGAVAASVVGEPRTTKDVDIVVWLTDERDLAAFVRSGETYGFEPRFSDAVVFARTSRVLPLRHGRSGRTLDVSLAAMPFEREMLDRARKREIARGIVLPLPTPEDLVIMKAVANRPQDVRDVVGLLEASPSLDRKRVRRWVKQFAEVLESPEILDDLERIFKRVPPE